MKTKTNKPDLPKRPAFRCGLLDPVSGHQIQCETLEKRDAMALLITDPDVIGSPVFNVTTFVDDRGERHRELIAVTTKRHGKILVDPTPAKRASLPQIASDHARIRCRLPDLGYAGLVFLHDIVARAPFVLANANEMIFAAAANNPAAEDIAKARAFVRASSGVATIADMKKAGFGRRMVLALAMRRHLRVDRSLGRFSPNTYVALEA